MSDAANRFKVLTEQGLGFPTDDLPDSILLPFQLPLNGKTDPISPAKPLESFNYPEFFSQLQELIKQAEPRYREFIATNAWRCDFYQLHVNRRCNTINGHLQNRTPFETRKTCSRCKNHRKNKKTLMQELHEVDYFGLNPKEEEKPVPVEENDDY